MTKREMFNLIATVNADNAEIVDFCNKEIALLEKRKSSGSGKVSKTQKENEVIKDRILEVLSEVEKATVSDLIKCEGLEFSSQKVSALLRQLIDSGKVEKNMEKKKAYFSRVAVE